MTFLPHLHHPVHIFIYNRYFHLTKQSFNNRIKAAVIAQAKKGENKMTQNEPLVIPPILVPLPLKFPWKQGSEHSASCSKKAIN